MARSCCGARSGRSGEKEPAKWTVEATDPSPHPNVEGSPGVAGDAKNAEIFYDNILVTKNAK